LIEKNPKQTKIPVDMKGTCNGTFTKVLL